jgi:antirestriction protein
MRKFFTIPLSDEPYKTTTDLNKTVQATYIGHRFLALCVHTPTGEIKYLAASADSQADLQAELLVDNDPATEFVILDADVNTFEAAYITHKYEHDDIPNYEETLPDNKGTYSYTYAGGAIEQNYEAFDLKYANGHFSGPQFRTHNLTRTSVLESSTMLVPVMEHSLAVNDYTPQERQELTDYISWLKNLSTNYDGIDHWKIPFPANPPKYY